MKNIQSFSEFINEGESNVKLNRKNGAAALKTLSNIDNDDDAEAFLNGLTDTDLRSLAFVELGRSKATQKSIPSLIKLLLTETK